MLSKFLVLGVSLAFLASCAIAPVKLRLVKHTSEADLHTLLARALVKPETEESKDALAHFIERWKDEGRGESGVIDSSAQRYQVTFATHRRGTYSPDYFDELRPAADFELQKLTHHTRAGAGVPLMALRENRLRDPLEHFYPPEAITRPVTALVTDRKRTPELTEVRIELVCPLSHATAEVEGGRKPLAADFAVPWGALLARAGKLKQAQLLDFLSRTPSREPRLYLMEPYDPQKEPLIMIHGLLSSPLVWATVSNELWADPAIRSRYQIWHYQYNTSAPALYAARLLREQLRTLRHQLDPDGNDPAMRHTTLITHSMGGLVGKSLALRPGDAFWKAAFTVPPHELKMSSEDRVRLHDAFSWEPDPTIHRIIFIAVPHRGSEFANNPVGRIGRWLSAPPNTFRQFYERISAANPGAFTPAYAALGSGRLDSVNALAPQQPTLHILAALPFPPALQIHSIIGNRGKKGPLEQSSDGVVPYHSSHLSDVVSEKIVPAGHGCVSHSSTIAEIRRILID